MSTKPCKRENAFPGFPIHLKASIDPTVSTTSHQANYLLISSQRFQFPLIQALHHRGFKLSKQMLRRFGYTGDHRRPRDLVSPGRLTLLSFAWSIINCLYDDLNMLQLRIAVMKRRNTFADPPSIQTFIQNSDTAAGHQHSLPTKNSRRPRTSQGLQHLISMAQHYTHTSRSFSCSKVFPFAKIDAVMPQALLQKHPEATANSLNLSPVTALHLLIYLKGCLGS